MFLLPGGSEQALIDAINSVNDLTVPLEVGDLYFGHVKTLTDGSGKIEVPTVAVYNSNFEGYVRFRYKRLNLSHAYQGIKPQVKRVGYPTLHRLLPVINETLGLSLSTKDVVDIQITWLGENEQVNIPVVTNVDSLGYEGQMLVEYTRIRPDLKDIPNKVLPVLNHPIDISLGMKSLAMATWATDYTDDQQWFTITNGMWQFPINVKNIMATHGFPNWPQAKPGEITSAATSAVPTANKSFTTVLIQKNVTINGFTGDAYFHFNRS